MATSIPRAQRSRHAVVIGASLAGLLAARALADRYENVTLIERDDPSSARRKGIPQRQHPHLLLTRGLQTLNTLFPGLSEQLGDEGAVPSGPYDWYRFGRWTRLEAPGVRMHSLSHALLERLLRERLTTDPRVRIVHGSALSLRAAAVGDAIDAVEIEERGLGVRTSLPTDLVIDASGRGSRTPRWFEQLGYGAPPTSRVDIDLAYSSCHYNLPDDDRERAGMVIVEEGRHARRAAGLMPIEGGRWALSLAAYHRAPAPSDHAGVLAFLRTLPQPQLHQLLRRAEPVTEVQSRKLPGSLWRRYDRLRRLPENVIVIGEALCSLNPASAAGISVAALEVEALQATLDRAQRHRARSYLRRATGALRTPWLIATSEDFAFSPTRGGRPPGVGLMNWYRRRTFLACADHPRVARRSLEVVNLVAPPRSLLFPDVLLPVLTHRSADPAPTPSMHAPSADPG